MAIRDILDDYVLTLAMIVITLIVCVGSAKVGISADQLPAKELLGGLLVLAGRFLEPKQ